MNSDIAPTAQKATVLSTFLTGCLWPELYNHPESRSSILLYREEKTVGCAAFGAGGNIGSPV